MILCIWYWSMALNLGLGSWSLLLLDFWFISFQLMILASWSLVFYLDPLSWIWIHGLRSWSLLLLDLGFISFQSQSNSRVSIWTFSSIHFHSSLAWHFFHLHPWCWILILGLRSWFLIIDLDPWSWIFIIGVGSLSLVLDLYIWYSHIHLVSSSLSIGLWSWSSLLLDLRFISFQSQSNSRVSVSAFSSSNFLINQLYSSLAWHSTTFKTFCLVNFRLCFRIDQDIQDQRHHIFFYYYFIEEKSKLDFKRACGLR